MEFPRQKYWSGLPFPSLGNLPDPGIEPVVSDSLLPHRLYSPRKSPGQNTGVGSLFLLQGIFLTQELNWGILHCRQILYQLSYQGSPIGLIFCQIYPPPPKSIFNAVLIFNDRHVGSYFSHHELNLYSLKWEHGVLTTRLPGKSHFILLYDSVVTINQGWSQDELK